MLLGELFPEEGEALERYVEGSETGIVVKTKPGKGSIDAYYGNLVIEFERDLGVKAKYEEGSRQIREYVSGLWNDEGRNRRPYIGIVTDGLRWVCYYPQAAKQGKDLNPADIELIKKDDFLLEQSDSDLDAFYFFLDRLFFRENRLKPTTKAFKNDFGLESPLWDDVRASLIEMFDVNGEDPELLIAFSQWGKYLEYTYGSVDAGRELFVRHSYLSVLARFLVATALWPDEARSGGFDYIAGIVSGAYFKTKSIQNLADEDFFHWVGESTVLKSLEGTWLRVLNQLKTYDFSQLDEDILKGVYQELVDPETRHDLGEFYTPDWLCERVVDRLYEDAAKHLAKGEIPSFMDPTCGSGSFLRAGIRKTLAVAREVLGDAVDDEALLDKILSKVVGVDINPLAVIISRANYILAIREQLQRKKRPVIVPVFLADTLFLPREEGSESQHSFEFDRSSVELQFLSGRFLLPKAVFQKASFYDELIILASEAAQAIAEDASAETEEGIANGLKRRAPGLDEYSMATAAKACFGIALAMAEKIRSREDHIWSFILRNTYRPAFFKKGFDIIAGNPPWLSYRYISDPAYQARVKELALNTYTLAPKNQALMTHMELATVFLVHVAATYLNAGGRLGFVMPRSLFNADQHEKFRDQSWSADATCSVSAYWDLEDVKPLFNVPSCVVFAEAKKAKPRKSYDALYFHGVLPERNMPWQRAKAYMSWEEGKLYLARLGKRSALSVRRLSSEESGPSWYLDKFYQGATIVPRNFYFIEAPGKDELAKDELPIRTDPEQAKDGKAPWKDIFLSGTVERELIYRTALSKHILPFYIDEDLPYIVLPLIPSNEDRGRPVPELVDAAGLKKVGFRGGSAWFAKAEMAWVNNRGAKNVATLEEWLNYQQKLVNQKNRESYVVLYNAVGGNISSAVCILAEVPAYITDYKLYWYETKIKEEANYLNGILNSSTILMIIRPFQASGLLGERGIEKVPLECPIPRFNPAIPLHLEIAERADEAAALVKAAASKGALSEGTLAKRRAIAREAAALPLARLDALVKKLFEG